MSLMLRVLELKGLFSEVRIVTKDSKIINSFGWYSIASTLQQVGFGNSFPTIRMPPKTTGSSWCWSWLIFWIGQKDFTEEKSKIDGFTWNRWFLTTVLNFCLHICSSFLSHSRVAFCFKVCTSGIAPKTERGVQDGQEDV